MEQPTYADALRFISGATDQELDGVLAAYKSRHKVLRQIKASEALVRFKVGDRVKITGVSPKYLNGNGGVITEIGDKFTVKLDEDAYTGRYARTLNVPGTCLEAP